MIAHSMIRRSGMTVLSLAAFFVVAVARSSDEVPVKNVDASAEAQGVGRLVRPASAIVPDAAGTKLAASIVARVDERVILLEEVVRPVRAKLQQAREQLPPAKYREIEWEILRQVTESKVQQIVVLKELDAKVPNPAVIQRIRKMAVKDFDKYVLKLARQFGLTTREEMEKRLDEEGSRIADLQKDFIDNLLAQQFLNQLIQSQVGEPTRDQLMSYYDEHRDDFADVAGAIWRHIEIKRDPDAAVARQRAASLRQSVVNGRDFEETARQHSQGPTAANGGLWSLTSKGSYTDEAVDQAIFSLPIGQISPVIDGKEAFHIIKVEKRGDGTARPFSEVQDLIRSKLKNEAMERHRRAKMDELMARHRTESVFDQSPPVAQ